MTKFKVSSVEIEQAEVKEQDGVRTTYSEVKNAEIIRKVATGVTVAKGILDIAGLNLAINASEVDPSRDLVVILRLQPTD